MYICARFLSSVPIPLVELFLLLSRTLIHSTLVLMLQRLPGMFSLHPLFIICDFFSLVPFLFHSQIFSTFCLSSALSVDMSWPCFFALPLMASRQLITLHYHSSLSFSSFSIFSSLPLSPLLFSPPSLSLLASFFLCVSTCMLMHVLPKG